MDCIITGCDAVTPDGLVYHGDLFQCGTAYVFNAIVDRSTMDPLRQKRPPCPKHIQLSQHYWDRRGVIVDNVSAAILSPEANSYVGN